MVIVMQILREGMMVAEQYVVILTLLKSGVVGWTSLKLVRIRNSLCRKPSKLFGELQIDVGVCHFFSNKYFHQNNV